MKIIVLVVRMFLFDGIEEEATFIYATMEECMNQKTKKEGELLGFPIERVEAACELQDPGQPVGLPTPQFNPDVSR